MLKKTQERFQVYLKQNMTRKYLKRRYGLWLPKKTFLYSSMQCLINEFAMKVSNNVIFDIVQHEDHQKPCN